MNLQDQLYEENLKLLKNFSLIRGKNITISQTSNKIDNEIDVPLLSQNKTHEELEENYNRCYISDKESCVLIPIQTSKKDLVENENISSPVIRNNNDQISINTCASIKEGFKYDTAIIAVQKDVNEYEKAIIVDNKRCVIDGVDYIIPRCQLELNGEIGLTCKVQEGTVIANDGLNLDLYQDKLNRTVNQALNVYLEPEFPEGMCRNFTGYESGSNINQENYYDHTQAVQYYLQEKGKIRVEDTYLNIKNKDGWFSQPSYQVCNNRTCVITNELRCNESFKLSNGCNIAETYTEDYNKCLRCTTENRCIPIIDENGNFCSSYLTAEGRRYTKFTFNNYIRVEKKDIADWKSTIDNYDKIIKYRSLYNIGFIYVIPFDSYTQITGDAVKQTFRIPFQFNPIINESAYTAKYNAISILSRIGDLQAYTGSSLSTLELTARFEVMNKCHEPTNPGNWMDFATINNIRMIENQLRSLVLPYTNDIGDGGDTTNSYYVRPPMLKIVLGDMFTHPTQYAGQLVQDGITNVLPTAFGSEMTTSINDTIFKSNFKTYVASSVSIKKDLMEDKIIISNKCQLLNTAGFTASISLLEVSQNYSDSGISDFNSYYNIMKERYQKDTGVLNG